MWVTLALALAVLALAQVTLVAILSARRPSGNVYKTIVLVAFVTALAALPADRFLVGRTLSPEGRLFLALTDLAIGGLFFHFMTLPDRSVTLRILVELLLSPGRSLSFEALGARYGVHTMIGSRLRQLEAGRFIALGPDGAVTLLSRGLWFGRFVTGGRRMFRISSAN